ncbi:MAG TPA: GvpL/GvpF family gas vesicle protein [Longimicrobiales bacterium]
MSNERRDRDPNAVEVPELLRHPLKPADAPDVIAETTTEQAAAREVHADGHDVRPSPSDAGLYLFGFVRARAWRGRERRRDGAVQRVRYRDLEALVRDVPFVLPTDNTRSVDEHQRIVEMVMRRTTILPAPFGIVFKGRRQLIKLMQEQYLVLDEGLSLLDGHWEMRLHISGDAVAEAQPELNDVAMTIYSELRHYARAAVPFPKEGKKLVSCAFLVDRTTWVEFIERIEDFNSHHPGLSFDVTGPWPPYDFVRIVV